VSDVGGGGIEPTVWEEKDGEYHIDVVITVPVSIVAE
jgi:hypothetical protein